MKKNCSTCKFWVMNIKMTRVGIGRGICKMTKKDTRFDDMLGCFIWNKADGPMLKERKELLGININ